MSDKKRQDYSDDFDPEELSRQLKGLGRRLGKELDKGLSQVGKTVENVAREVGDSLQQQAEAAKHAETQQTPPRRPAEYRSSRTEGKKPFAAAWDAASPAYTRRSRRSQGSFRLKSRQFLGTLGGYGWGTVMLGLAVSLVAVAVLAPFLAAALGLLALGAAVLSVRGFLLRGLCSRGQRYLQLLEGQKVCSLQRLSQAGGQNEKKTLRDLRQLRDKQLLPQLVLDEEGSQVFTSMEAYEAEQQRRSQQEQRRQQAQQEQARQQAAQQQEGGRRFLVQIEQLSRLIDDEAIRGKVDHIRLLSEKIFEQVEQNPRQQNSIRKFTSYYLPTTVKLLRVYTEVDDQPVEGVNTDTIRSDIPGILDTLSGAYENLLDSLYADMALDVSAEITVLKDMLAQEGLVEDDLTLK